MASTKEYLDYVLEQLCELEDVTCRAMMGEYILYYKGRIFGGIYDDHLLVKPVESAKALMPNAEMQSPYEGGSEMVFVDNLDNAEKLCELIEAMYPQLPESKRKK